MAQLDMAGDSSARKRPGVRRMKKPHPRIDMTPMVDLSFLLITFFMLASSFAKPKVIKMISPADGVEYTKLNCNRALTLLLDETSFVKYYTCPPNENEQVDSVDFSKNGLLVYQTLTKPFGNQYQRLLHKE